ncbi:MAG: tellurite resistance TerB family protein [Geminicoccaceae bacterium]
MDPKGLLEQFLGPNAGETAGSVMQSTKDSLTGGGLGTFAAGGLLGALIGNKKARKTIGKMAGGVVGYGGAAALGALAYRAYQNYQSSQPGAQPLAGGTPPPLPASVEEAAFLPSNTAASDGRPFELALVMAMITAANADGHIDSDEQRSIFDHVGQVPLDAEDKAFVFDALSSPPSLQDIAGLAKGLEQASELYLVSRLAIDPDHPMEKAYLEALASRLSLPGELVRHLEQQVATAQV